MVEYERYIRTVLECVLAEGRHRVGGETSKMDKGLALKNRHSQDLATLNKSGLPSADGKLI